MDDRFEKAVRDRKVRHDMRVLGAFVRIWCDAHHANEERGPIETDGARAGVYGRRGLVLCPGCADHLAYAEKRRAYCPKDPKPFCAHCDSHCYRPSEAEWQRGVMRFSGPRSWKSGFLLDGIKHVIQSRKYRNMKTRSPQ